MRCFRLADALNTTIRQAGTSVPVFGVRGLRRRPFLRSSFFIVLFSFCSPLNGKCASLHGNAIPVHASVYRSEIGGPPICPKVVLQIAARQRRAVSST